MPTPKGMSKLLKHHGLTANSTDKDVDDAIENSVGQDDMDEMENRAKKAEDKAKEGEKAREQLADETLDRYKNRIGDKPETKKFYRDALLANREETIKALDALPGPTSGTDRSKPLHNRNNAGIPAPVENADEKEVKAKEAIAHRITNRAKKIQNDGGKDGKGRPLVSFTQAFNQAESQINAETKEDK